MVGSIADYLKELIENAHNQDMTPREYILSKEGDPVFKKSIEMNAPLLMWDSSRWLDLKPKEEYRA